MTAWMAGHFWPPINHDAAIILAAARLLLNGDTLYVDIIDINPPLIFYLSAIPELLAQWTGQPSTTWFIGLVISAILAGALACRRLASLLVPPDQAAVRSAVPLAVMFVTAVFPDFDFGQREHLLLIALCPYLLLATARWQGVAVPRWLAAGIAVAAAVGFCLKPTFLLTPAIIELALMSRRGRRATLHDPVPWLLTGVTLAYGLIVIVLVPQYLSFAVPFAMEVYRPIGDGTLAVLGGRYVAPLVLVSPLFVWAAWRWSQHPLARMLFLALVAMTAAAVSQGMGWRYHCLPALALALWLGILLAAEWADRLATAGWRPALARPIVATAPLLLIALVWVPTAIAFSPFQRQLAFEDSPVDDLVDVIREFGGRGPVLILSQNPWPSYPAMNYSGVRMASRFQTMWAVAGAYTDCPKTGAQPYRAPASMLAAERFAYNSIAEDFARNRPTLVFVQKDFVLWKCHDKPFDFLAYFRRHPLFERSFARYAPLMEIDNFTVYHRGPVDIQLRARLGELAYSGN